LQANNWGKEINYLNAISILIIQFVELDTDNIIAVSLHQR